MITKDAKTQKNQKLQNYKHSAVLAGNALVLEPCLHQVDGEHTSDTDDAGKATVQNLRQISETQKW